MTTRFYHTRDPIENLRIRVIARKVRDDIPLSRVCSGLGLDHHRVADDEQKISTSTHRSSHGDAGEDGIPLGLTVEYTFQWQEKRHPITPFLQSKKKTTRKKVPSSVRGSDKADTTIDSAARTADGMALCSYTEADDHRPESVDEHLCFGVASPSHHPLVSPSTFFARGPSTPAIPQENTMANRGRLQLRVHREDRIRQMHIALAITASNEVIHLASLRFYPSTGLLCATPGFSCPLEGDDDMDASIGGPKLSTNVIQSHQSGARFEFALDNEADLFPLVSARDQQLYRELEREEEREDIQQFEEWRNKHGDSEGRATSAATLNIALAPKLLVLLEIVSVVNIFSSYRIRVGYQLHIDKNSSSTSTWVLDGNEVHRGGFTHFSQPVHSQGFGCVAVFGHHCQFVLSRRQNNIKQDDLCMETGLPTLTFSVTAHDSWGREWCEGVTELRIPMSSAFTDCQLPMWTPMKTTEQELEDFFLGTADSDTDNKDPSSLTASTLTRFGMWTKSTNTFLRLRLHVNKPEQVFPDSNQPGIRAMELSTTTKKAPKGVIKRSVDEILRSIKQERRASLTPAEVITSSEHRVDPDVVGRLTRTTYTPPAV